MRTFETDLGSLDVMRSLTRSGRNILEYYLRNCDRARTAMGKERERWSSLHFERDDVVSMSMEHDTGAGRTKILTTIDFRSGARWGRGSLRMPGVDIPDTIMQAIRGRLIEELVEGSPVKGFRITHAVRDNSAKGVTLRVRCDGEKLGPIPYDPPAPYRHHGHEDGKNR